jgi:hypothetical protein
MPDAPNSARPDAPLAPDAPGPAATDAPASLDAPAATLTVVKAANGAGTVTAGDFICAEGCASGTVSLPTGTKVTLSVLPAAGSYFQGWDGACSGRTITCQLDFTGDAQVTARFAVIDHNLVFATSTKSEGTFGALAVADQACADRAVAVGLTGHFKAFLSTSTVNAVDRLVVPGTSTPARGWIRLDGLPLFDATTDITTLHRIWYPVLFDEQGTILSIDSQDDGVWTGTEPDGKASPSGTCGDWMMAAVAGIYGSAASGSQLWTHANGGTCAMGQPNYFGPFRFYCFMVDKTAPLAAPMPAAGKKIWATKAVFASGGGKASADDLCAAEKPAGVTDAIALLNTTTAAASTLLTPGALYVRPDGVAVGTTEELIAASTNGPPLPSGIWQNGDGTYITNGADYAYYAYTGGNGRLDVAGTVNSTCNDWTSTAGVNGTIGLYMHTTDFWNQVNFPCDSTEFPTHVSCVEK